MCLINEEAKLLSHSTYMPLLPSLSMLPPPPPTSSSASVSLLLSLLTLFLLREQITIPVLYKNICYT